MSHVYDNARVREMIEADPSLSRLMQVVTEHMLQDSAHDTAHLMRVARWTLHLGNGNVDERSAIAAALLHDFVNLPKSSPKRALASEMSADAARKLLPELGFDAEQIEEIALAIQDHSFSRGAVPTSMLGKALQDADRLDALGVIGTFRCIGTSARLERSYSHPEDPWAQHRDLDDTAWAVDHFFTKLLDLPDTFNTAVGMEEAANRAQLMREMLEVYGEELGVPAPWAAD